MSYTKGLKIKVIKDVRGVVTAEQGRNPSWMPADMTDTECIKEGLSALTDYFNAALDGDESPAALRRMWKQQMGILSLLLKHQQPLALKWDDFETTSLEGEKYYLVPIKKIAAPKKPVRNATLRTTTTTKRTDPEEERRGGLNWGVPALS